MIDVKIVGWRAWYTKGADGKPRIFNSVDHRWADLPTEGVLVFCLYQKTRPRRRIMVGVSLYWHIPEKSIFACDNAADAKIDGISEEWIKHGQWVDDVEYQAAIDAAMAAMDAPDETLRVDE